MSFKELDKFQSKITNQAAYGTREGFQVCKEVIVAFPGLDISTLDLRVGYECLPNKVWVQDDAFPQLEPVT